MMEGSAKDTVPYNKGDPMMDVLLGWGANGGHPHLCRAVAKPKDTTSHTSRTRLRVAIRPVRASIERGTVV